MSTTFKNCMQRSDAGILAPGRWLWPRVLTWAISLFGMTFGALFIATQWTDWAPAFPDREAVIALFVPAAMMLFYALLVRIGERRPANELNLSCAPLELVLGAVAGFAFITLVLLLLWALGIYDVRLGTWRDAWHYFVFDAYVSAVLEEIAFRAILLRLFARVLGPVPGLILSAVLFGLAHAGHASPVAVVELIINGGGLFGLLFLVSGRLWLPIGAHIAYDFTEWSLMGIGDNDGLLVSTPSAGHASWLTGGSFGPDGSVLAVIVGVSMMAMVVVLGRRISAGPDTGGIA